MPPSLADLLYDREFVPPSGAGIIQRTTPGNEGEAQGIGMRRRQVFPAPTQPEPVSGYGGNVGVRKNIYGEDEYGVVTRTGGFTPIRGNPGTMAFKMQAADLERQEMLYQNAQQDPRRLAYEKKQAEIKDIASKAEDRKIAAEERRLAREQRGELAKGMLEMRREMQANKPLTESQGRAAMFGTRAAQSHKILQRLEDTINLEALNVARKVPLGIGNYFLDSASQRVDQAQRDFVNAVLRQESGAVIAESEFQNAKKQYFPQPGDSKEVIEQKRQNRMLAIKGFKRQAGKASADIEGIEKEGMPEGWSIRPKE